MQRGLLSFHGLFTMLNTSSAKISYINVMTSTHYLQTGLDKQFSHFSWTLTAVTAVEMEHQGVVKPYW